MTDRQIKIATVLQMAVFGLATAPLFVMPGAEPPPEILLFALGYPNTLVIVLCVVLLRRQRVVSSVPVLEEDDR